MLQITAHCVYTTTWVLEFAAPDAGKVSPPTTPFSFRYEVGLQSLQQGQIIRCTHAEELLGFFNQVVVIFDNVMQNRCCELTFTLPAWTNGGIKAFWSSKFML